MSLDLRCIAIVDIEPLRQVVADVPTCPECIEFIDSFYEGDFLSLGPIPSLERVAEEWTRSHPGIATRVLRLDKDWDFLHYWLSPARRKEEQLPDDVESCDMGTRVVRGGAPVHPAARATQGSPIRFLAVPHVAEACDWLRTMDERTLTDVYHRDLSTAVESVYNWYPEVGCTDADLRASLDQIQQLKDFYQVVARNAEGLLFVLD
jgi:hypothetical protein